MESLNLLINTATNRALNQDGITGLRSITLAQGETYKVNLKFIGDTPSIDAFAFYLRKTNSSINLVSVSAVTAQEGDYPYFFTLTLSSPTLSAALAGGTTTFNSFISWTAGAEIELIEAITTKIAYTGENAGTSNYVSSLNSVTGEVTLTGAGSVSVSQVGQTVTISGTAGGGATGDYFPNASGEALQGSVAALQAESGTYYPANNPSGYIGATALSGYVTASGATTFSNTGNVFFGNGGALINVVNTTGTQNVSGVKTFKSAVNLNAGMNVAGGNMLFINGTYLAAPHVRDSSQNVSVYLDLKELSGPWKVDGKAISTTRSFSQYGSLSKIVTGTPDTPATSPMLGINFNAVPLDGETISMTVAGSSQTFEFSTDGDPGNGNKFVDISAVGDGDIAGVVTALIAAFNDSFLYSSTQSGGYTAAGTDFYFLSGETGATASIAWSATGSYLDNTTGSGVGADLIPGTPDSGNRSFTLLSPSGYIMITNVVIKSPANTPWANADIAIGYLDGSNNFYPVYGIGMSDLTATSPFRFTGKEIFIYPNGFQYLNYGNAIADAYLVAMTVSPGGDGLTPMDEVTGDDVEIIVQGYTF